MKIQEVFLYNRQSLSTDHPPTPAAFPNQANETSFWWSPEENIRLPYELTDSFKAKRNGVGVDHTWSKIKEHLGKPNKNIQQWIDAIRSYTGHPAKDFETLRILFEDILNEDEKKKHLGRTLPEMAKLALQLPDLLPHSLPKLRQKCNRCIHLSQQQVACLMANAFFCTYPAQEKKGSHLMPNINFETLYRLQSSHHESKLEKIRFLLHYFSRVGSQCPTGTVTFYRRHLTSERTPDWTKMASKSLDRMKLISNCGIETREHATLQLDFAHKRVGGLVLDKGCVQEEIRFMINPELVVSRLFTETLDDTEVLFMTGMEQFSRYTGYRTGLKWAGDVQDHLELDEFRRRRVCIVAMDALSFFRRKFSQFDKKYLHRELNKAYCGFAPQALISDCKLEGYELDQAGGDGIVATGNWGCGVYMGDDEYKLAIQLLAAAEANRQLEFIVFDKGSFKNRIEQFYKKLNKSNIDSRMLYKRLLDYNLHVAEFKKNRKSFFNFVFNC